MIPKMARSTFLNHMLIQRPHMRRHRLHRLGMLQLPNRFIIAPPMTQRQPFPLDSLAPQSVPLAFPAPGVAHGEVVDGVRDDPFLACEARAAFVLW